MFNFRVGDQSCCPPSLGSVPDITYHLINLEKLIYFSELNALERGNCKELRLTDLILKVAEIIIEKLIRQEERLILMRYGLVSCQDMRKFVIESWLRLYSQCMGMPAVV